MNLGILLFGSMIILGLVAIVGGCFVNDFFAHRERMAKIKAGAWKLDGDKISASAKKHLPIRDGHYVIPEEWKVQ